MIEPLSDKDIDGLATIAKIPPENRNRFAKVLKFVFEYCSRDDGYIPEEETSAQRDARMFLQSVVSGYERLTWQQQSQMIHVGITKDVIANAKKKLKSRKQMKKGIESTVRRLRNEKTRAIFLFKRFLESPKRMWIDEVATLDDIPDPEKETSFHLGFRGLEKHLRFPRKGFITVLGPYESGKSTFLRQLIYNMSMHHGWRSAITCFEESAKWRTVNALRKTAMGKPIEHATDQELAAATDWVRNNVVFIQKPKRKLMTAKLLLDRIEYAVKFFGLNMVIIDPFNEIDHSYSRDISKTEYVANFIMEFKTLADSYGIILICCVHPPSEAMRRQSARKSKLYTLADAADSSHFANKSDIGLCFWRPGVENITLLNIDKIKNAELCGKPTGVEFVFNPNAERYSVNRTGWEVFNDQDEEAAA